MKTQIKERKSCCPLLERGETEIEPKCIVLKTVREFIRQLKGNEELPESDLQKMCGG